jgi:hypothetical protein
MFKKNAEKKKASEITEGSSDIRAWIPRGNLLG